MVKKVHHLGIAVKNIEEQLPWYQEALGMEFVDQEVVESQKVKVAFFKIGDLYLELLEPTSEDSPVAKFIEKKGEGIHHLAYEVADVEDELAKAKERGIRLIDEKPRVGSHQMDIAFLHPKSTHGVLTEFCKPKSE